MIRPKEVWRYIKNYKYNSIFVRDLFVAVLLIIVPLGGISLFYYKNTDTMMVNEISASNLTALNRIKDMTDSVIQESETIAANVSLQDSVNVFMLSANRNDIINDISAKFTNISAMYTLVNKYLDSIYVFSDYNQIVMSNREITSVNSFKDNSWLDMYKGSNDNMIVFSRKKNNVFPYLLSVVKPVTIENTQRIGAVIVNIKINELQDLIKSFDNPALQKTFIINKDNRIIYSEDNDSISRSVGETNLLNDTGTYDSGFSGQRTIGGEAYMVSVIDSKNSKLRYISLIPLQHYTERIQSMGRVMFGLILIMLIITVIISMLISLRSFNAIANIIHVLDYPDSRISETFGNKETDGNELKYIISNIMKTVRSNNELKEELERRIALLDKAHFFALQTQINPHFLYNTLDTISMMAADEIGIENKVSKSIVTLSRLFRSSNEFIGYMTKISEEVQQAKLYEQILKLRHSNMFDVVWDIDQDVMKYKTVKLILQPLIENAVYHGIKPTGENGIINIGIEIINETVQICVEDKGVGMSEEKVNELNAGFLNIYELEDVHIGLSNVNQRIKLICGNSYGIRVESNVKTGAKVIISMPIIQ